MKSSVLSSTPATQPPTSRACADIELRRRSRLYDASVREMAARWPQILVGTVILGSLCALLMATLLLGGRQARFSSARATVLLRLRESHRGLPTARGATAVPSRAQDAAISSCPPR